MRKLKKIFISVVLLSSVQVLADSALLCTGDRVISDSGIHGTVVAVFQRGAVSVHFNAYSGNNEWPTRRLAQTKGCSTEHYCVGRGVINDSGIGGEIAGIYPDGQVAVHFNGYSGYNQWLIRTANRKL